eukprot:Gregarina_sp_Pseudo_9__813@NODE_151_length_3952_cov_10_591107_g138_i0_p2_GENE_NODE_151_length_3952_cov_10_591107_g138_i0NODE_151_length_3952_cov_10_591107_g138_i0_p2_ORF_typecomplete_len191_score29_16GTP_cyclohydroI/PF01227_22/4_1e33QueF/PF14489_6/9_4e03QueF/PF14489_6/0_19_NODE_151_length_3952_cov_10_591107_g138_i08361408
MSFCGDHLSCDCEIDKKTIHRNPPHFTEHIASHIEAVLTLVGADEASNNASTHRRVARALWAMTHGHRSDPFRDGQLADSDPRRGIFASPFEPRTLSTQPVDLHAIASGAVAVRKISFTSLCEHHMLPFFGHASICYIPAEVVLGLSKFCRIVRSLSKMLQIQERFTSDIAGTVESLAEPKGVYVQVVAK